ncbi:hypothetical protein JTB14_015592 [Gonioctena quinquepunctata]|nr:hypothetical protein JTB14_015592 [Gonioctena quinquepunctata]
MIPDYFLNKCSKKSQHVEYTIISTDIARLIQSIDIAFGEDDEINGCIEAVYIAPPNPATLADGDFGDEDEGGNVDNLSRRQLLADTEVRTALGTTLEEDITSDETQSQESDVLFKCSVSSINDVNVSPAHTVYPKVFNHRDWISGDFTYNEKPFLEADYSSFRNKSIVDFFEMFLDEEIIYLVAEQMSMVSSKINPIQECHQMK